MAITLNGSSSVVTNSGAVYDGIQSGTAVTASGTSVDFTDIPSWVKRITVMFQGVSTNGASLPGFQLGTTSSIENTGYVGSTSQLSTVVTTSNNTTGWYILSAAAVNLVSGSVVISLLNSATNTWVCQGMFIYPGVSMTVAGSKSLASTLTRLRVTTFNGTDAFDAGSINILYE
jgi:hypothetical protein